jgi:hypothetical protein
MIEESRGGEAKDEWYVSGVEFESQCFCVNESEDEGGISMEQTSQLK